MGPTHQLETRVSVQDATVLHTDIACYRDEFVVAPNDPLNQCCCLLQQNVADNGGVVRDKYRVARQAGLAILETV